MADKILFVDDEPLILDGYKRMLHSEFDVSTAQGGEQGLASVGDNGPYAVVISDMRMPGMSGAEFLAHLRQKAPETVRMLLTGYTGLDAAMSAVNEGNIFRYLTKPCDKQVLIAAINIGIIQYHTVRVERELIKKARALELSPEIEAPVSEPVADDEFEWDNYQGPTGLPGPTQARSYLAPLFGSDNQQFAVLFKLASIQVIEERYGGEAVCDYVNFAAQSLMQSLRSDDRLFHWKRDVLMSVVRRQGSPVSVRMEMARMNLKSREYLINVDGRCIMLSCPASFELLPLSQYSTLDEMLAAIETKLIQKI
jgi:CheY-like chemotaxis protein